MAGKNTVLSGGRAKKMLEELGDAYLRRGQGERSWRYDRHGAVGVEERDGVEWDYERGILKRLLGAVVREFPSANRRVPHLVHIHQRIPVLLQLQGNHCVAAQDGEQIKWNFNM